ncbi:MAG TPA: mechanosensitive ion channel domain-containing protein [Bacteroidales bacterium]|nr:mechanosensitive ion channel domain-containing protein [Bacteroidales bacterium]
MERLADIFNSLIEPGMILVITIIVLIINSLIFRRLKSVASDDNLVKKTISFTIIIIATVSFILALPIERSLKGQILSFLGIIISAGIALSSTTVLGNMIAGIMNNSMKRFKNGDLIKIGDLQGRVVRRSIFHTEIQLEDSNFVTIPNLYIASNPVKLTRKTNTVISTTVSLGYDVPRTKIEEALKKAAEAAGLNDPYVYITELGDYSVVYKIHGFLADSGKFFSTTSLLNAKVMDLLHEYNIEIVSPTFMNQRRVDEKMFIPVVKKEKEPDKDEKSPEELIFNEALEAAEIEKKKENIIKLQERKEKLKAELKETKDSKRSETIKASIERIDKLVEKIETSIKEQKE